EGVELLFKARPFLDRQQVERDHLRELLRLIGVFDEAMLQLEMERARILPGCLTIDLPHLHQENGGAAPGEIVGGGASGKAAADGQDIRLRHAVTVLPSGRKVERMVSRCRSSSGRMGLRG